uniref:Uncharacterized protein n=2 Tax=Ditylum brightwellii TaxID=49249 RepID=A0A7S1ZEG3_9STRA|mmetsp:Transcript_30207/g.44944  ORF Transcript_30207/g.44944 Transcript_30207/m.44944 type:complete len:190 (+) Transcript_30207:83-652(+)
MMFYVRVITLSFLLSPSLAGSFAPHRFLQDLPDFDECGTCEEITEYVEGFCCGMDSIGDRCFENLLCILFACLGEFGDDNFDDNFDDGVRGLDEIDGKFGNEDYGDEDYGDYYDDDGFGPPQGLPVCNNFNCDECGAFTDQVVEECCPFVIDVGDGFELDFGNPDSGTCLNTLGAFQISCIFNGCVDEN